MSLKELRERAGISQDVMAKKMGVSVWTYYRYEQSRRIVGIEKLILFKEIVGCTYDEVMGAMEQEIELNKRIVN